MTKANKFVYNEDQDLIVNNEIMNKSDLKMLY